MKKIRNKTIRFECIGLLLLLTCISVQGFADMGPIQEGYVETLPDTGVENSGVATVTAPPQLAQGRNRGFELPDTGVYAEDMQAGSSSLINSARRQGRLTPEERRALRQQINDAGYDLYHHSPRR